MGLGFGAPKKVWLNTGCGAADLDVRKTDLSDPVVAGNMLSYTIVVSNAGPGLATGVTLTDTLPAGVMPGGVIMTNLGTLDVGASTSIIISLTVDPSAIGVVTNVASVNANNMDRNMLNNVAIETTAVNTEADLTVMKSCPAAAVAPAGPLAIRLR